MRKFEYFYGTQAAQFSFIRIPRAIIVDEAFSELSTSAKLLYAVLLDRITLSMRNGWFDEENRAYIIYQISDIQKDFGFSRRKAMDYLGELETFGLLEKKKRGFGKPSILYVKSFQAVSDEIEQERTTEKKYEEEVILDENKSTKSDICRGSEINTSRCAETDISRDAQFDTSEVFESIPLYNKTNSNKTNMNQIPILSHRINDGTADGIRKDEMLDHYALLIKEHIAYEALIKDYPFQRELIDGIYELILETVISQSDTILIASERYPASLVKSRFLKLDVFNIRYVIECLNKNTTQVKNIRKYLLATLFNAPTTMSGYYKAAVNHDMPQYAL